MKLETIKKDSSVKGTFEKINRRTKKNATLAEYYADLYVDFRQGFQIDKESLLQRADRLKKCCQYWDIDYYKFQGVKDVIRTNRCDDRFCDCCGSAQAKQREEKFTPFLDELAKRYDVYHIVLTVPNPEREQVQSTVDVMYKKFARLIRYFQGSKKIKGIDFTQYGFIGAIRALEITKSKVFGNFHPHFHCLFVFRKGVGAFMGKPKHINSYSFNNPDVKRKHRKKQYGEPERFFTDFEILLQKVWFILMNDVKVTKENVEECKLGYSAIVDNTAGKYHEVFKYATKGIFKDKEEGCIGNYYDFVAMFFTLYKRHVIQGYGVLRHFNFEEPAKLEADERYNQVIETLRTLEDPQRIFEFLDEINENIRQQNAQNVVYISRASINDLAGDK